MIQDKHCSSQLPLLNLHSKAVKAAISANAHRKQDIVPLIVSEGPYGTWWLQSSETHSFLCVAQHEGV